MSEKDKDILRRARDRLADEKNWYYSKSLPPLPMMQQHCMFSAIAAEHHAMYNAELKANGIDAYAHRTDLIRRAFGLSVIDLWNLNDYTLTHEQMLTLMDSGINNV